MVPTGQRDKRVSFQRPVAEQSAMGREPGEAFTELCLCWAKVLYGSGAERRAAGTDGATQAATFIVRDAPMTRDVSVRDSIWFDNRRWNITSSAPIDGDRHFTAVTSKG
jgi:SPP1 family predicted phage head-tail adaptor